MGKKRKKRVRSANPSVIEDVQTMEKSTDVQVVSKTPPSQNNTLQQKLKILISGRENLALFSFLVILIFITYWHALPAPFFLDDVVNITENQALKVQEIDLDSLKKLVNESISRTRPVANISFAVNYLFHKDQVSGFRLVNIFIHLMNGFLLFYFLRLTFALPVNREKVRKPLELAFWVSVIWLVHPLHVQSVTYIVQRMNSMATLFFMLAFILYIKARLTEIESRKWVMFTVGFISFLMGLGSKEIAITLPIFVLIYEWYFFRDLQQSFLTKNIRAISVGSLLLLVMALVYTDGSPLQLVINGYGQRDFTLMQRIWTEPRVIIHYIDLILFPSPHRLALLHEFDISRSVFDPFTTLPAFVFLNGLVVFSVLIARKHRLLSFCLLWFFGNLVLESSFIGLEIIFEHRTYLPSMLLGVSLTYLFRSKIPVWASRAGFALVLVVFATWTFQRNSTWLDSVEFWQDNMKKNPLEARTYLGLGQALEQGGDIKSAIYYYEKASTLTSDKISVFNILGSAKAKAGQLESAIEMFETALKYNPEYAQTHYNIALAFSELGYFTDAMHHYEMVRNHGADTLDPDMHNNLGILLSKAGQLQKSIEHFQKSLQQRPNQYEAYNNLGVVYIWQKDYSLAAHNFRRALSFNSNDPVTLNRLGAALMYQGKHLEAYNHLNRALKIDPGFQPARESLLKLQDKL